METRVLGIDPGMTGAAVEIDEDGEIAETWSMPTIGKDYDVSAIRDIVSARKEWSETPNRRLVVAIEQVKVFPARYEWRVGKKTPVWGPPNDAQKLMACYAFWFMAAACYRLPTEIVPPRIWQRGIPVTKGAPYAVRKQAWWAEANRRWPGIKKKHADAALIDRKSVV